MNMLLKTFIMNYILNTYTIFVLIDTFPCMDLFKSDVLWHTVCVFQIAFEYQVQSPFVRFTAVSSHNVWQKLFSASLVWGQIH